MCGVLSQDGYPTIYKTVVKKQSHRDIGSHGDRHNVQDVKNEFCTTPPIARLKVFDGLDMDESDIFSEVNGNGVFDSSKRRPKGATSKKNKLHKKQKATAAPKSKSRAKAKAKATVEDTVLKRPSSNDVVQPTEACLFRYIIGDRVLHTPFTCMHIRIYNIRSNMYYHLCYCR